jgi:hypothetical protein
MELFPVSYSIAGLAGTTPTMQLNLTVDTARRSVRGHANISSLVGNVHKLAFDVDGYFLALGGEPGIIVLRSAVSFLPLPILPQLDLVLSLTNGWKEGKASYMYTATGVGERTVVQNAIVTLQQPRAINDQ